MKHVARLVITIVITSVSAFAATLGSVKIILTEPVQVGSNKLLPGNYKVTWTSSGSKVNVTFAQGKKVFAIAPATLQIADNGAAMLNTQDGVELDTALEGGATALQEIQLAHLNLLFKDDSKAGK